MRHFVHGREHGRSLLLDSSIRFVRFAFIASVVLAFFRMDAKASAQVMAAPPLVEKVVLTSPGTDEFTIQITVRGAGDTMVATLPVSAVIALDRSPSMKDDGKIGNATMAAIAFVEALAMAMNGDQAAVVSFGSIVIDELSSPALTDNLDEVIEMIDNTETPGSGTNLDNGLLGAIKLLDADTNDDPLPVIIFLTDGGVGGGTYTFAKDGGPASIAASDERNYTIYSIGVGSDAVVAPLEDMANATKGRSFTNRSSADLDEIFDEIFMDVVLSTIPRKVNVVETTLEYIVVDCATASPAADTCERDATSGKTTLTWDDIGTISDGETTLMADEEVILRFRALSTQSGFLPVNDPAAEVTYEDSDGNMGSVPIPQAFINDMPSTKPTPCKPKPYKKYSSTTSSKGSKGSKSSKSSKGTDDDDTSSETSKGGKSDSNNARKRRRRKRRRKKENGAGPLRIKWHHDK